MTLETDAGTGSRVINWKAGAAANPPRPASELAEIPPGTYKGEIVSAPELHYTPNGTEVIGFSVRITEGAHSGRRLFENFYLSERALWRLRNFLWTCGFSAEQLDSETEMDDLVDVLASLVEEPVTITVVRDTYDPAKPKAKIKETRAHRQAGYPPRLDGEFGTGTAAPNRLQGVVQDSELPF